MTRRSWWLALVLALLPAAATAAEPFRYPEGKHGKGELKYVNDIPVLVAQGTPEEIGEQVGALALKPSAGGAIGLFQKFLKDRGLDKAMPLVMAGCRKLYERFPDDLRKELEAMSRTGGVDLDLLIVANTFVDFAKLGGCSGLIVEPGRSKTNSLLYGRNTDLPPLGNADEYSLVIVYKQNGKRPFATVTFPGAVFGTAGVNASGLCLGVNEVTSAGDESPRFNSKGSPMMPLLRRLLEGCATVTEAEKFLRDEQPTTMINIIVCDKEVGTVFEVTTKTVIARKPEEGLCSCTNHFRTKELATDTTCRRFDALETSRKLDKVGPEDVAAKLDAANQGDATMQTMIFEPAALKLSLALGKKSSAKPLKLLELEPLLRAER